MPARLETRIGALSLPSGSAGWFPLGKAVPAGHRWNVNLLLSSRDSVVRFARLAAQTGAIPGSMGIPLHSTLATGTDWDISPLGTYLAHRVNTTRVDLYARSGPVAIHYLDSLVDAATVGVLAFSPDERWLAWASGAPDIGVVAVGPTGFGASIGHSGAMPALANSLGWSPSGAYLAATSWVAPNLNVFPFASGAFGSRIDAPSIAVNDVPGAAPRWSPNEAVIAWLGMNGGISQTLYGWPWASGAFGAVQTRDLANTSASGAGSLSWDPDASLMIIAIGQPRNSAFALVKTARWTAGAWSTTSLLNTPSGAITGSSVVRFLSSRRLLHLSSVALATWALTNTGTEIATFFSGAPPTALNSSSLGEPARVVDGVLHYSTASGLYTALGVAGAPTNVILPGVAIPASGQTRVSGLVLDALERLVVGTPASTDWFDVVASAIDIG